MAANVPTNGHAPPPICSASREHSCGDCGFPPRHHIALSLNTLRTPHSDFLRFETASDYPRPPIILLTIPPRTRRRASIPGVTLVASVLSFFTFVVVEFMVSSITFIPEGLSQLGR